MTKENIAPFICLKMLKQLLMRAILMMYLNQTFVQLYQTQKLLGKRSGSIIDSVVDYAINNSKYKPVNGHAINNSKDKPLNGNTFIKLPKDLYHPKKV